MKWIDTREIEIALADAHPDVDPVRVNFVDLHRWVTELDADIIYAVGGGSRPCVVAP